LEEGTEADRVRRAIASGLAGFADPGNGRTAIRNVMRREELYSGPYASHAPDLLVNFCPGYRVSWQSAVGGFQNALVEDNTRRWSGDHIIDPDAVPGVLFMNCARHPGSGIPHIIDLAPTILNHLGVPVPKLMEGTALF
jgi:predicted AlkP superfamily phosphohydrolase/phosphomutase